MPKLVADTRIKYNMGTIVEKGDEFSVSDEEAKTLIADSSAHNPSDAKQDEQPQEPEAPATEPQNVEVPASPDSATRTELEQVASQVGVEGPFERFDTKADLHNAILEKQGQS